MKLKSTPVRLKEVKSRLGNGFRAGQTERVWGSRWVKLRREVLTDEPLCRSCKKMGFVSLATEVDHIVPLWMGGKEFERDNLQPICRECHIIKTSEEATRRSKQFDGV